MARTRSDTSRVDALLVLTIYLVALVGIPSQLIVGPLGQAGTPAEIIGLGLFGGWAVSSISARRRKPIRQPVRIMMWLFALCVVISYIAANSRTMLSDESRSADAGVLLIVCWAGIMLMAMDLITTRAQLDILLRRLSFAAGALGSLGVLQFATKQPFTNYLQLPGLKANEALLALYSRGGLTRPTGTAAHPIEFGAVLTMCLPIALHYAFTDKHRPLLRRWYPVAAIAFAVPISISRSAIVSAVAVLIVMIPFWPKPIRRKAYGAIVVLGAAMYLVVPGLIGTLTSLFTGISTDSSAQSRSDSFSLAFQFIDRSPFIGRGFLTFLPEYRTLDDQYLGLLIGVGFVGLAVFLALLVTGVWNGLWIRRHAVNSADASLAVSLSASVMSALASFALFDAFSFPMASGTLFLILGSLGALYRLRATVPSARIPDRPAAAQIAAVDG